LETSTRPGHDPTGTALTRAPSCLSPPSTRLSTSFTPPADRQNDALAVSRERTGLAIGAIVSLKTIEFPGRPLASGGSGIVAGNGARVSYNTVIYGSALAAREINALGLQLVATTHAEHNNTIERIASDRVGGLSVKRAVRTVLASPRRQSPT